MPHRDHPDSDTLHPIEEAIRPENDLPMRKLGELGKPATEMWELFKRAKPFLSPKPKALCGRRIVFCDVTDGV